MKKRFVLLVCTFFLAVSGAGYADDTSIKVQIDGINMDRSYDGRIMGDEKYSIAYVPLRTTAETLGYSVKWLPELGAVSVKGLGPADTFVPQTGEPDCWCTEPPMLVDGKVWVPSSFVEKIFSASVDVSKSSIQINTGKARWVDNPNGKYSLILDVRNPDEFEAGHLNNAVLIPVLELEKRMKEIAKYKNEPILVYCKKGGRSSEAVKILREAGFDHLYNLKGGYDGYLVDHPQEGAQ